MQNETHNETPHEHKTRVDAEVAALPQKHYGHQAPEPPRAITEADLHLAAKYLPREPVLAAEALHSARMICRRDGGDFSDATEGSGVCDDAEDPILLLPALRTKVCNKVVNVRARLNGLVRMAELQREKRGFAVVARTVY